MPKDYYLQYRYNLNETFFVENVVSNVTFIDYKLMNKEMFWLHLSTSSGFMDQSLPGFKLQIAA